MSDADWKAVLPEALHDMPYLKDAETPEAFKEQLVNAAQWQGNSIRIPGPDATPESIAEMRGKVIDKFGDLMPVPDIDDPDQFAAVMGKLGRPEVADSYKLPEGIELADEMAGKLKTQAFAMNMTQGQFAAQVSQMQGEAAAGQAATTEAMEANQQALQDKWGDALAQNKGIVEAFLKSSPGVPESILADYEAGRIPADQVEWLHGLAQLGDEGAPVTNQGNASDVVAPAEAKERLLEVEARLFGGQGSKQMHASDPAYADLVAKRMKYMLAANPELQAELAEYNG